MLLGIPGDNTFANYHEANRSFFRQTVLPLAARTGCAALWKRVSNADFLTLNEKREAVGYAPLEGGDHRE